MKYYIGLDTGLTSTGFAVTDVNYKVLRYKGKDMWGVRMYEEAQTSEDRSASRISRRLLDKRNARIGYLKAWFEPAIMEEDELFYIRMDNSRFHQEDKMVPGNQALFDDADYKDADYYAEYPTIYHLRKELIEDTCPHDGRYARKVFLALLNMYKNRGHFLAASLSENGTVSSIEEMYDKFRIAAQEKGLNFPAIEETQIVDDQEFKNILSSHEYSRTQKVEMIAVSLGLSKKDKLFYEYVKAICGLSVDPAKLFPEKVEGEIEEMPPKFSFAEASYDDKYAEIAAFVGSENEELLGYMKLLHDSAQLADIMKGFEAYYDGPINSFSAARVSSYNKHKADLKLLKNIVHTYGSQEEYNRLFKDEKDGSYSAYVKSIRGLKGRKVEDLYGTIKNLLKKYNTEDENIQYVLAEIETGTFLPKQRTIENKILPNQVHLYEMKQILKNAEKVLPFLQKKNEKGLTVSEQVTSLFSFCIPYYVGPTSAKSQRDGGNGWVVRKADGPVMPWNIEEKIDMAATNEKFIEALIRKCTYMNNEKVLPKASLLYQRFAVLDTINNIRVCGEKITAETKQDIYNNVFAGGKKATRKKIAKYLKKVGVLESETDLTGVDETIGSSLESYAKFYAIFGDKMQEKKYVDMAEEIVRLSTIYGKAKDMLRAQINARYGSEVTEQQIKQLLSLKFKDWGKLSKAFLNLEGVDPQTGEVVTLLDMMWNKNLNLMELLNAHEFGYGNALADKQSTAAKTLTEFTAEDLKEYYFSAPVRRMIWQLLKVVNEIVSIMGGEPDRIFIEKRRSEDSRKQRTISKKNRFIRMYDDAKDMTAKERKQWKELIQKEDESGRINSKKMQLYLLQQGRCMYTGKPIDLMDLFNDNKYNIDHIYPQVYCRDESLENNLVLVSMETNKTKDSSYPVADAVYERQLNMWRKLRMQGFMTAEKYARLTNRHPLSLEQKAGFIARQVVELNQGAKGVADILKQLMPPSTTIVYTKASNVGRFRQEFDLPKSLRLNDFYCAYDAYLNIVVGNVYYTKFTQNPLNYLKKLEKESKKTYHYHLGKVFRYDVERNGSVAWIAEKDGNPGTIATVRKHLAKNSPMISRMNFTGHGQLFDATMYSACKASDAYVPLKTGDIRVQDVTKYGGHKSVTTAYFFLVEHTKRNKKIKTLEAMPIYMAGTIHSSKDLHRYCVEVLGLESPRICVEKILLQSLISFDGYEVYLSGRTGEQVTLRNAMPMYLNQDWVRYIHKIEHAVETNRFQDEVNAEDNMRLYEELTDKHLNGVFNKRPTYVGATLENRMGEFEELDVKAQCRTILEVLRLTMIGPGTANLEVIGESKACGKLQHTKRLKEGEKVLLINKSVTGLRETRIDLAKL